VTDDEAMAVAMEEAVAASAHGDVPVGAVVLGPDGELVARRHNEREKTGNPTAHAELLALRDASAHFAGWRMLGATVVATLEPCPMCAGALVAARVSRLVFATADPKAGACGSLMNLCADDRLNHSIEVSSGLRETDASDLLKAFFAQRRSK
jgi:tRNA(adenine34) deaminase